METRYAFQGCESEVLTVLFKILLTQVLDVSCVSTARLEQCAGNFVTVTEQPEENTLKVCFGSWFLPTVGRPHCFWACAKRMWHKGIVDGNCLPYCREKQKEYVEQEKHFRAQPEPLSGRLHSYRSGQFMSTLEP